jgi:hypothetical protein
MAGLRAALRYCVAEQLAELIAHRGFVIRNRRLPNTRRWVRLPGASPDVAVSGSASLILGGQERYTAAPRRPTERHHVDACSSPLPAAPRLG